MENEQMDENVRKCLHKVLAYMVDSEAKTYWHRRLSHEREGWAYESALVLMRHFGFSDLVELDQSVRDMYRVDDEDS